MNNNPKRIIYVDIMRAIAVIMMIQGHTVDTLLAPEYRTMDSIAYAVWHTFRGFTAPIFMFTAGLIFTYLLKSDNFEFLKNPRIKKGLKRGLLLIIIGYILRYPTYSIFDFSNVRQSQWDIFFAVDALHLIGFGMLVIIFSVFLAKRVHLNMNIILYSFIVFLLIFSPFIVTVDWIRVFPQFIASYFTRAYGSLFPIFPWLVYVLAGSLLGNYLYKNDGIYLKKRFSLSLLVIGGSLISVSLLFFSLKSSVEVEMSSWFYSNGLIFLRVGYVILLNSLLAFIVRKFNTVPKIIVDTGKKTLMLYVLHVIILYGCAWLPGLYRYYGKSFSPLATLIAAFLMLASMLAVVKLSEQFKNIKKRKLVFNKV